MRSRSRGNLAVCTKALTLLSLVFSCATTGIFFGFVATAGGICSGFVATASGFCSGFVATASSFCSGFVATASGFCSGLRAAAVALATVQPRAFQFKLSSLQHSANFLL
jgi:hypothetical protein